MNQYFILTHHILSTHSSASGYEGCFEFWLLWTLLGTAIEKFFMWVCFHFPWVCIYLSIYLYIYLEVEFLGHVAIPCLTVWGADKLFYTAAVPCRLAPTVNKGSNFSTSLATLIIVYLFYYNHPTGVCMVFLYDVDLYLGRSFLNWYLTCHKIYLNMHCGYRNVSSHCNTLLCYYLGTNNMAKNERIILYKV